MPGPIPLTIANGIWIQSAVLPQYTFQTDRQTRTHTQSNRWTRRQVNSISAYARYIYTSQSDVLIIEVRNDYKIVTIR